MAEPKKKKGINDPYSPDMTLGQAVSQTAGDVAQGVGTAAQAVANTPAAKLVPTSVISQKAGSMLADISSPQAPSPIDKTAHPLVQQAQAAYNKVPGPIRSLVGHIAQPLKGTYPGELLAGGGAETTVPSVQSPVQQPTQPQAKPNVQSIAQPAPVTPLKLNIDANGNLAGTVSPAVADRQQRGEPGTFSVVESVKSEPVAMQRQAIDAPMTAEQAIGGMSQPTSAAGALLTLNYGMGKERRDKARFNALNEAQNKQGLLDIANRKEDRDERQLAIDAPYKEALGRRAASEANALDYANSEAGRKEAKTAASAAANDKQTTEMFGKAVGTYEKLYGDILKSLETAPEAAGMSAEQRAQLAQEQAASAVNRGYAAIGGMFSPGDDAKSLAAKKQQQQKQAAASLSKAQQQIQQDYAAGNLTEEQYAQKTDELEKQRIATIGR